MKESKKEKKTRKMWRENKQTNQCRGKSLLLKAVTAQTGFLFHSKLVIQVLCSMPMHNHFNRNSSRMATGCDGQSVKPTHFM